MYSTGMINDYCRQIEFIAALTAVRLTPMSPAGVTRLRSRAITVFNVSLRVSQD
jgi:hypothetical protein